MRDPQNISELVAIEPDYIGFIFHHQSKRYVGEVLDQAMLESIPENIKKVGVFVNRPVNEVMARVKINRLDYVQLHGDEDTEYCKKLYYVGIPLIKVFRVSDKLKMGNIEKYKMYASYFLFDTKTDKFGGSGKKFKWDILKNYDNQVPLFLSGGICVDDAKTIRKMKDLNIHAVDINSNFEVSPGVKDIKQVKQFKKKLLK